MRTARDLARFYARVLAATVVLSAAFAGLARHLIVNCTESMPLGLYWLSRGQPPHRRDLVAFPIPDNVRELVHDRRYLPDGALLLKQVVALPGDRVCTDEGVLTINSAPFGAIAVHDRAGRPLPHPTVCGTVAADQLYVASRYAQSFDSRSFGPLHPSDLRGTVTPLWTFSPRSSPAASPPTTTSSEPSPSPTATPTPTSSPTSASS